MLAVGVLLAVGVMLGVSVSLAVGLGPGVTVGLGPGVNDGVGVSVRVDVGDGPGVFVRVGVSDGSGVADGRNVAVTIFDVDVACGGDVGSCVTTPVGITTYVAVRATVGSGVTVSVICDGASAPAPSGITWSTIHPAPKRHRTIVMMNARCSLTMT